MNHKKPIFVFAALVVALVICPVALGQNLFLDRPVTEPDSDPGAPITDPTGSWHELYPTFSSLWNCLEVKDNGTGVLDESDWLYLEPKDAGDNGWYHVENVTITITVDRKVCACVGGADPGADCKTVDDCLGIPDGTCPAGTCVGGATPGAVCTGDEQCLGIPPGVCDCTPTATVSYLEYMGAGNALGLSDPTSDSWHEVYPVYSEMYNVVGWIDGGDGRISASDQIQLVNKSDPSDDEWYHVDRVSWDIEVSPTDFKNFNEICTPGVQKPPCDDEGVRSLGSFQVFVDPRYRSWLEGYPGWDGTVLTSPILFDENTVIGRSSPHRDGDPSDLGGTPVGKKGTVISDFDFSIVPTNKPAQGFAEGPPGTREVHTEIQWLNLCSPPGCDPNIDPLCACVLAGHSGKLKVLPLSPGEVESKSLSGKPTEDFPAESFFNVFVEVWLPAGGAVPFPGTVLHNLDPLLVTSNSLNNFPPTVVYIHEDPEPVPIYFNLAGPKWQAGARFGWLVLVGHGVGVDQNVFEDVLAGVAPLQTRPVVECDGEESGGKGFLDLPCTGTRQYVYPVADPNGVVTDVQIGTHDPDEFNYDNVCVPVDWDWEVIRNDKKVEDFHTKTPHGAISDGPKGACPYVIRFYDLTPGDGLPDGLFRFGFDNPQPSHDVGWQISAGEKTHWRANWNREVGMGYGPVHAPAVNTKTALILGNTDYGPGCVNDLPGVVGDVLNKQNALENAGWPTVIAPNRGGAEMADAIWKHIPPVKKDLDTVANYIVWYAGHGKAPDGALVGTDCVNLTPQDLIDSLDNAVEDTLVILDSCLGGDFANAANALAGPEPNGLGFITAGGKGECVSEDEQKGLFSRCFVDGLNGLADLVANGGNGDGLVTVAEAAAYAIANCSFPTPQTPTWDGEHGDWVIGATKEPDPTLCDGTTAGCWSGCLTCETPDCDAPPEILPLVEETNFTPVHLALIQADFKINRFQEAVHEILLKQDPPPKKIIKVANVQDAIDAIRDDFVNQGRTHVTIFGHGSPGQFKVGEDILELVCVGGPNPGIQCARDSDCDPGTCEPNEPMAKFTKALKGNIKELALFGCEVGQDQAFLKKLTEGLQLPVHTWEGKVYAFPNKWPNGDPVPENLANRFFREIDTDKKEIPAVTPLGMVVMAILVLAAGAVVIKRARALRVQG